MKKLKKLKNWFIKKLGGYTADEYMMFRDFEKGILFKEEKLEVEKLKCYVEFDESFYRVAKEEDIVNALSGQLIKGIAPYVKITKKEKVMPCMPNQVICSAELKVVRPRCEEYRP